jgi:hypothetical protein
MNRYKIKALRESINGDKFKWETVIDTTEREKAVETVARLIEKMETFKEYIYEDGVLYLRDTYLDGELIDSKEKEIPY